MEWGTGREESWVLWSTQGTEVREAPAGDLLQVWDEPAEIIVDDRNESGGPLLNPGPVWQLEIPGESVSSSIIFTLSQSYKPISTHSSGQL